MKTRYFPLVWLAAAALALPAVAQDEPPRPPADDAAPPAGEAADDAGEADDERQAEADEVEEREFIFSEEIPADQQVTFPVDI